MAELLEYFLVLAWQVVSNFKKTPNNCWMCWCLCLIAITEPTHLSLYLAVGLPKWFAEQCLVITRKRKTQENILDL